MFVLKISLIGEKWNETYTFNADKIEHYVIMSKRDAEFKDTNILVIHLANNKKLAFWIKKNARDLGGKIDFALANGDNLPLFAKAKLSIRSMSLFGRVLQKIKGV